MTLATKNGSLIVKDGKIAEDCGCCGDWYCKTAQNPLSVTVSGWSPTAECTDDTGSFFRTTFPFRDFIPEFNGTYATTESCGDALVTKNTLVFTPGGRGLALGGNMAVRTWLSNLSLSNAVSCQSGFMSRKVSVSLDYWFRDDFSSYIILRYRGAIELACVDLNSLPQVGSWISGQSFSVPVSGGPYRLLTSGLESSLLCPFPTLEISVSFQ